MLPDFDQNGNLPSGIHHATIEEVIDRFGRPSYGARRARTNSLRTFFRIVSEFAVGVYVNGSYITLKQAPGDVDLLVILPDGFDWHSNEALRLRAMRTQMKDLEIFRFTRAEHQRNIDSLLGTWSRDRDGNPKGVVYVEIAHD